MFPALLPVMVKGGLNHAVKGLALELADAGIMVNAIAPGLSRPQCTRRIRKLWKR
ncbi:3-ketoacyl-(acyl-carrier-protein) reductase [Kluyvera cryocrescens]|uniref:3-ketoacyl-(Acyl-carrier-protein) reductase n=1 Tax=Kluyvera cryocrescens TaxID=580 RepID=A0A485CDY5_KLUCR|nr:3-ketoacyl-(acyl-carrier-protein) reductase [Kluyvera cryocrescens]